MVFPCSSLCFRGIVHSQTRKAQAQHCGDLRKLKGISLIPFFSSYSGGAARNRLGG